MNIRHAEPDDYKPIIAVLDEWWGGRRMRDMLPKLFFVHFRETSLILEQEGRRVGFLAGFFSQSFPDEAYIHFVGIDPALRGAGLGQALYDRFFQVVREHHRHIVRCVTSPVNQGSIAFHRRMGFEIEQGAAHPGPVPFFPDYDGPGEDRVLFIKRLP